MLKHISVALLIINSMAAWASPHDAAIYSLSTHCLQFPPINLDQIKAQSLPQAASSLERQLLTLSNLSDKVNFFRTHRLSRTEQESLLDCQLHLSDRLQELTQLPMFSTLTTRLKQSKNNEYQQWSKHLSSLIKQQNIESKSKLHTAEASFLQGMKSKNLKLDFNDQNCQINKPWDKKAPEKLAEMKNFEINLASYLLKQTNDNCRKQVWQSYQTRAKQHNQQAMARIIQLRNQQAQRKGFADYSHQALADTYLQTPKLAWQFLQSQTHNIGHAPWNIGRALAQLPKVSYQAQKTQDFITNLSPSLSKLGLTTDWPQQNVMRLWHRNHLLGDIYLAQAKYSDYQPLTLAVTGRQYASGSLYCPPKLTSLRQQQQLLDALAQAISDLSGSSRFYLNNLLMPSRQIGMYWLRDYLNSQLKQHTIEDKRNQLANDYSQQLRIFRAKIALETYIKQNSPSTKATSDTKLTQAFKASFGENWPDPQHYKYSFSGIIAQGPKYFLPLWQEFIGQLIFEHSSQCLSPESIYNVLLINEKQLDLQQQLKELLGSPVDPASLLRRSQGASISQNWHSGTCAVLSANNGKTRYTTSKSS